jgi:hypothetical protein
MKYIKEYKEVEFRIKDLQSKIKQITRYEDNPRLKQKVVSNGILLRLQERLSILEKRRYELETISTVVRVLSFLHII